MTGQALRKQNRTKPKNKQTNKHYSGSRMIVTSSSPWGGHFLIARLLEREQFYLPFLILSLLFIVLFVFNFKCHETSQMDSNKRILLLSHPEDRSEDM